MKRKNNYRFTAPIAAVLLFISAPANAERSFPCLEGSIGKSLQWNARWQNDQSDQDVRYRVADLLHFETTSSYSVVLKLLAESDAKKAIRHLSIGSANSAQRICEGLHATSVQLSRQRQPQEQQSIANRKTLPFIRFGQHGWVRSDLPGARLPLSTCEIMGREFLCLEEEKQRFSQQLADVAEQIEAQPDLRR